MKPRGTRDRKGNVRDLDGVNEEVTNGNGEKGLGIE